MEISRKALNVSQRPGSLPGGNGARYSVQLLEKARADSDTVLKDLGSQLSGLSSAEADSRLKQIGTNEIAREKRQSALMRLLGNIKNPLVLLLLALGVLSYLTGDLRAMGVIFVMVVLATSGGRFGTRSTIPPCPPVRRQNSAFRLRAISPPSGPTAHESSARACSHPTAKPRHKARQ